MSWLFSQALVEEFSAATSWGGAPSAPLSVMPTQHKFWRNDKTMESSKLSQFGLTCAVLTDDLGEALLTWFLADSRVRTYRLPGMALESLGLAPGSGSRWHELSVRYDLERSTWRTHLCLWEEDLPWSSVTLPKWGMTHAGVLLEQLISAPPISAIASGLWPTPNCLGYRSDGELKILARKLDSHEEFMAMTHKAARSKRERSWPTPVASASKGSSPATLKRKSGADRSNDRLDHAVMATDGGQLNPEWVEWLMGWPIGWTALKPLGMDKFHEWQRQHSKSSPQKTSSAA